MADEKEEMSLEQRIEVESQQAQSAEHAAQEAAKMAEILSEPEKADRTEAQTLEPVRNDETVRKPDVSRPTDKPTTIPKDTGSAFFCQTCGKGPWDTAKARDMHVRAAHTHRGGRPTKPQLNKSRPAAPQDNGEPLPAPDFSDIDGGRPPAQTTADPGLRYETMAGMSFDMTTGILARVFGPEWNPSSADERAAVVLAIKKYYESVQLPDIPPGYMLCFVCAAYAAPRLGQQPTRTKLQAMWLWVKLKFTRRQQPLMRIVHKDSQ